MLKFSIVRDLEYGEDGCVTTLYCWNGLQKQEVISGDYYHDKIDDKIDGFFSCLDFLELEYSINEQEINWGKEE